MANQTNFIHSQETSFPEVIIFRYETNFSTTKSSLVVLPKRKCIGQFDQNLYFEFGNQFTYKVPLDVPILLSRENQPIELINYFNMIPKQIQVIGIEEGNMLLNNEFLSYFQKCLMQMKWKKKLKKSNKTISEIKKCIKIR